MKNLQHAGQTEAPLVDRGSRSGTAARIILLAFVLLGVAIAFVVFKNQLDNEIVLGLLGILAMVGIFFLVSAVIGFVEIMPQSHSDELARAFLASRPEGTVITDTKGRVIYANAAYGRLTGARKATEVQSLETLLSKQRESSEALYRLANRISVSKAAVSYFACARVAKGMRNSVC